jgi:ABC-type phosphate/phosphonate transport system substrate-binding protein
MLGQPTFWLRSGALLALACAGLIAGAQVEGGDRNDGSVRIALSGALVQDVPEADIKGMSKPFNRAVSSETGLNGELLKVNGTLNLAQQLTENRVQLGIFTGHEFAWARQKYPNLKPLAIAVSGTDKPQALIIVPAGSAAKQWADLQGISLSRPRISYAHVLLFLERGTQESGKEPKQFFSKINTITEPSEALDDVVEGVSQSAAVDNVTWAWYQKNKPKRTAQLRVAIASEKFPPTVVAYEPGNLDATIVKKFRKGMLHAHENETGKQLMDLWKVTGFEETPSDLDQSLKDILKVYPAPAAEKGK